MQNTFCCFKYEPIKITQLRITVQYDSLNNGKCIYFKVYSVYMYLLQRNKNE